jgi:hypothetical protein
MGSLVAADELRRERAEVVLCEAGRVALRLSAGDAAKAVRKGLEQGMKSPRPAPPWGTVHDRNDAILRWFEWYEQLAQEDFMGTKGSTLLRLFAGFTIAGINVGKVDIGWSIRQAAEGSGLSRNTVSRLLKAGGEAELSGYLMPAGRRARPGDLDSNWATIWHPIIKRPFARQYGGLLDGTKDLRVIPRGPKS